MEEAFWNCNNLDITATDVPNLANVSSMNFMFGGCTSLSGPSNIGSWVVSNVTDMQSTFAGASVFNQNIGSWNVANVTNMRFMFSSASAFNQDLGSWGTKFNPAVDLFQFLNNSGLNLTNYDATLTGFNAGLLTGRSMGAAGGMTYCLSEADRANLIKPIIDGGKGWTISDDTISPLCKSEIKVTGNGNDIASGTSSAGLADHTQFGSIEVNSGNLVRTFTIQSMGLLELNLTAIPKVTVSGSPDFTVTAQPNSPVAAIAGTSTFQITFEPSSNVVKNATVEIESDDPALGNYTFAIQGTGICTPLVVSPGDVVITWTGFLDNDWNTACNWNPASVPDMSNAKVVIPSTANQPIISGTVPTIKVLEITAGANLEIATNGELNVRGNGGIDMGIMVAGNLTNRGLLNLESETQTAAPVCIYLKGSNSPEFYNYGTANLNSTTEAFEVGVADGAYLLNDLTGQIHIKNGIGFKMAEPTDVLNVQNNGKITYDGDELAFQLQGTVTITNTGEILINSGTGIESPVNTGFNNNDCGKIIMNSGTFSGNTNTNNSGLFQMPNDFTFRGLGNFNNYGVLKADSVFGVFNDNLIITNTCSIFDLSRSSGEYDVEGIYTDARATISAGAYDIITSTLTILPSLPVGEQTLYAKVTRGSCVFAIPFDYNNLLPSGDAVQNLCPGSTIADVVLTNTASSTYKWYNAPSGPDLIGTSNLLVNGTTYYAAQVLDGCEGINRLQVQILFYPKPATPTFFASQTEFCIGESTNLSANNIPDPVDGFTFHWTGGLTGESITVNPSTSQGFRVAVRSADGCLSDSSVAVNIIVNQLPLNPGITTDNASLCKGETVILSGSCETNTFFNWSTPSVDAEGANTSSLSNTNQRAIDAAGTYTGYCESAQGCVSGQVSIVITESTNCGNLQFITISPAEPTICTGETVTLTASGCAGTYTWFGGPVNQTGNTAVFSPALATTYFVTCSTGGSATIDVSIMKANEVISTNISTGSSQVLALETIVSNKKVGNPSVTPAPNVIYQSGKSILLSPGFEVSTKSIFKAFIQNTCPE
jgi:surface protein